MINLYREYINLKISHFITAVLLPKHSMLFVVTITVKRWRRENVIKWSKIEKIWDVFPLGAWLRRLYEIYNLLVKRNTCLYDWIMVYTDSRYKKFKKEENRM